MKALVFDGPHQLRLTDLPEPEPGEGEVKLRVRACGICGSDVHGYTGESGRRTAGQVMGHEFAGEVLSVGRGVGDWGAGTESRFTTSFLGPMRTFSRRR